MKNKLMIMLILCTTPCFAEENTLYEEDACFDNYQANNRVVINIGDCNNAEKSGKWIIAGNKLTTNTDGDVTNYEILRLDKSTLKLKSMVEHNVGSYFISTFEKVSK